MAFISLVFENLQAGAPWSLTVLERLRIASLLIWLLDLELDKSRLELHADLSVWPNTIRYKLTPFIKTSKILIAYKTN